MKVLKQIFSVVCTVVVFVALFVTADFILTRKDSRNKFKQFVDYPEAYDVLFFGTSHMLCCVSPLDLFRDYGITSFNFGGSGNLLNSSYYQMQLITQNFKDKIPKVIVFDIYNPQQKMSLGQIHNSWDYFKSDKVKWNMVQDIRKENAVEIMFPFSVYHSRWNEAIKEIDRSASILQGVDLRYVVGRIKNELITNRNIKAEYNKKDLAYIEKMRLLCEKHGIKFILLNPPYLYNPEKQKEANDFYDYAKKHNLIYVNYNNENVPLEFEIDSYDSGHLNPTGIRIMTAEIGKLLRKTGLSDRRNDPIARYWENNYKNFIDFRIERLKNQNKTNEFLMACNDPDLVVSIEVNNKILADKIKWLLIERLEKIEGNTIKKSFDKVTHTKADKKTQKCDISAVVFRRDSKKEVFRAAFSSSEKMK